MRRLATTCEPCLTSISRRAFPWACIFFALYTSGFIGVEVVEEDEEEEEEEEEEHGHEDEGEDAGSLWFIPLPFTEELHQLPDYPKNSPVLAFFSLVQHRPDVSKKIRGRHHPLTPTITPGPGAEGCPGCGVLTWNGSWHLGPGVLTVRDGSNACRPLW